MINTTAIQTREIRVFLSSTFRDMDAERSHLVKQVFPKVRAACLERQVGFSEIDLRWGVSEEESKNGATVEICLKEIDRCRDFPPFFVGFLGERYGWVPRHDELAAYWQKHGDSQYATSIRQAIERSISVTELEMELAVLGEGAADKIAGHALFCLRDAALTDTLYREQTGKAPDHHDPAFYDAGNGKLAALKANIRQSGYLGLDNYTSIEQFGSAVENYLLAQLDRYFPADAVPSAFERGNAAHAAFRFHRLQNFLPRIDVREHMIRAIEQRIEAPSLGPILVTGPSGQGKSALMADLARYFQKNSSSPFKGEAGRGMGDSAQDQPIPTLTLPLKGRESEQAVAATWRVFDHYIGADNGNHLEGWVERVLNTLHPDIADLVSGIPESPKDKIESLSTWISMAARRNHCRYLFVLDALDQLGDGGQKLDILTPQTLGPDGILIASAADGTPALTSAADWQTHIEVPPLTGELRTQLVTDTLARYRKRLPENLARKLAHAPQSGSPLYLGLALEELRVDARHETLDQLIDDTLKQPDAEHLFLNNFLLDTDYGRPELPTLAASFMALLGAARAGLSEDELADLLALSTDPIAEDTGKPRLPQIHLSRLLNNFAPFLLNKQGRRAPMHRTFGKVALEYYGTTPVREHLYAHFAPGYGKDDNEFEARGATEALHQITELAKLGHKRVKKRLIDDVGFLPMLVMLLEDKQNHGSKAILDAILEINSFMFDAPRQVSAKWQHHFKNATWVDLARMNIRNFIGWLNQSGQYWLDGSISKQFTLSEVEKLESEPNCDYEKLIRLKIQLAGISPTNKTLKSILKLSLERLGENHDLTAELHQLIGNHCQAAKILKTLHGLSHPDTINSISAYADQLIKRGEIEKGKGKLLKIFSLGPVCPEWLLVVGQLGLLYKSIGDKNSSEDLYAKVIKNFYDKLDHPLGLSVVIGQARKRKDEVAMIAINNLIDINSLAEKYFLEAFSELAKMAKDIGMVARAKEILMRATMIIDKGDGDLEAGIHYIAFGQSAIEIDDYELAEYAFRNAIEILNRQSNNGESEAPFYMPVANKGLADTMVLQSNYIGAALFYEKVLPFWVGLGGWQSAVYQLCDLVDALLLNGEEDKAEQLIRKGINYCGCAFNEFEVRGGINDLLNEHLQLDMAKKLKKIRQQVLDNISGSQKINPRM